MLITRALLFVAVAACSSDPLAKTRDALVGTWQQRGALDSTEVVRSTFHPAGEYERHERVGQQPEVTQLGRWKLVGSKDHPQLQTCVDGDECKRGGIWTTENVFVSGDVLTTTSPNGGAATHWSRYSKR